MQYKVGDRVRIKSIDWYNENKNEFGDVRCSLYCSLTKSMSIHCGSIQTIESVVDGGIYWMKENPFNWADEMIEGLMEEEIEKKLSDESWRYKNIFDHSQYPQSFECPEGYIFKDENGNVINATKIVLEKKKKEYPKTYKECCKVLGIAVRDLDILDNMLDTTEIIYSKNLDRLLNSFRKLLICRDVYWKIAGEELGLGKPWEPDWTDGNAKYSIYTIKGVLTKAISCYDGAVFVFPTEEMRDAFKENFDADLEFCKELL